MKKIFFILIVLCLSIHAAAQTPLIFGGPSGGGGGATVIAGTAAGQMLYWDAATEEWTYTETNELFFDDTLKRLGIGTNTPNGKLDILDGTNPQLALTHSTGIDATFQVDSSGDLTINTIAGNEIFFPNTRLVLSNNWGYAARTSGGIIANLLRFDTSDQWTAFGGNFVFYDLNANPLMFIEDAGSTGQLGLGTLTPNAKMDIVETTEQLRVGYDGSNYTSITIESDGDVIWNSQGTNTDLSFRLSGIPRWEMGANEFGSYNARGGRILFTSPTETIPTFTGQNIEDTGISFPADAEIAFITDSTQQAKITNNDIQLKAGVELSSVITPPALSGHTENWNPTGLLSSRIIRASSTANYELRGLNSTGMDNRKLTIINIGTPTIKFKDESLTSTAAYRFVHNGDVTIAQYEAVELWYDTEISRWIMLAH